MATKKTAAAAPEVQQINVSLNTNTIRIPIVGVAPLIMSRFDEKSKTEIAEKAPGKLKQGKKAVASPEEQYEKSIYHLSDGKTCGFPAVAFKAAIVRAAKEIYEYPMTSVRTKLHVLADDPATGYVEIKGEHYMREDMVRVGTMTKVASPRYRACFPSWSAVLTIRYISDTFTPEQIVGFVNAAGFACGVGEWRPEKSNSGSFGLFEVANTEKK